MGTTACCILGRKSEDDESDELLWEYECNKCGSHFSVKVPKGPTEERALRCPHCHSDKIIKLTAYSPSEAFCGG
jgi:DNA-directed RNA polymerase subunit RPC12/RpoP